MFKEIEVGPHFVTFYTSELDKMLEVAKEYHPIFCEKYPGLADYQQPDFKHEENDPKVYHRFGEPNAVRPYFRHFHIRTLVEPSEKLIDNILTDLNIDKKDVIISKYMDYYPGETYPSRGFMEGYLDYIERLKRD